MAYTRRSTYKRKRTHKRRTFKKRVYKRRVYKRTRGRRRTFRRHRKLKMANNYVVYRHRYVNQNGVSLDTEWVGGISAPNPTVTYFIPDIFNTNGQGITDPAPNLTGYEQFRIAKCVLKIKPQFTKQYLQMFQTDNKSDPMRYVVFPEWDAEPAQNFNTLTSYDRARVIKGAKTYPLWKGCTRTFVPKLSKSIAYYGNEGSYKNKLVKTPYPWFNTQTYGGIETANFPIPAPMVGYFPAVYQDASYCPTTYTQPATYVGAPTGEVVTSKNVKGSLTTGAGFATTPSELTFAYEYDVYVEYKTQTARLLL